MPAGEGLRKQLEDHRPVGQIPPVVQASEIIAGRDDKLPDLGPYVLPGNNYHVYDIPLFWRNLQRDVERRMRAWAAARS